MKAAAGTASVAGGLVANSLNLFGEEEEGESSGALTRGDAAMFRFAAAVETLQTDFWVTTNWEESQIRKFQAVVGINVYCQT